MKAWPELPIPAHFDPAKASEVWRVPYEERAHQARSWARQHRLQPAARDEHRISLVLVDVQNTFCIPGYELYVGGRSGTGAVDDNRRLSEFIYRNLGSLTEISATLDTHHAMQIFHPIFLMNDAGEHPAPYTLVSAEDIHSGRWKFNPAVAENIGVSPEYGQEQLRHYTEQLLSHEKYELTIWPYHAMQGGIGHALVSIVEEAVFFHTIARKSQAEFTIKGDNPLTESYSAIGPEVLQGPDGRPLARKNPFLLDKVQHFEAVLIAGQAKSHCVAWTVDDLLSDIQAIDPALAKKVYLLEDCSSPVVVPGADYTDQAETAYEKFARAGMHRVRSTEAMEEWLALASTV